MTDKGVHRLILIVGIIFQNLGIILFILGASTGSMNSSIIGTYEVLLGLILLLEGFILVIFEIIRNHDKKRNRNR